MIMELCKGHRLMMSPTFLYIDVLARADRLQKSLKRRIISGSAPHSQKNTAHQQKKATDDKFIVVCLYKITRWVAYLIEPK